MKTEGVVLPLRVTLWSVIACLAAAQASDNCECVAYFYCNTTQYDNNKCDNMHEVCCDLGGLEERTRRCGQRGKPKEAPGSVVDWKVFDNEGNTETAFGEFPWMVAILKESPAGGQEFLCGGSIVHPSIILTTAHTISGIQAGQLSVKAGVWNTTDTSETAKHQDRSVARTVLHSGFDRQRVANDFAVLVLDQPLNYTDNIAPVCLPTSDTPVNKSSCIATGWGADSFDKKNIQSVLRKVTLPLIDSDSCQWELRKVPKLGASFSLHESFICAGKENADTCTGDGGGPLVCSTLVDHSHYIQVGITSWGVGCGQGTPGVYSSIAAAADWIQTQISLFTSFVPARSSLTVL